MRQYKIMGENLISLSFFYWATFLFYFITRIVLWDFIYLLDLLVHLTAKVHGVTNSSHIFPNTLKLYLIEVFQNRDGTDELRHSKLEWCVYSITTAVA
jgi:hypothetical protein